MTISGQPAAIRLDDVAKSFGGVRAVDGVSLDIARGNFFCLVGASGSGKTTLLRTIAGFEAPDRGRIVIDGEDVTARPPYKRPVNMMFQSYALFPHFCVFDNVAFGLKEERRPKAEIAERVAAVLKLFDMSDYSARKPHQLSGGQKQRVALARALVKNPKILLLDEPLAALDKKLRERAQLELVALRERVGITFVMVTHDQDEAMSVASHIGLMRNGKLLQVGTPRELYDRPQSRYAADFFGFANLFDGKVAAGDGQSARVDCADAGSMLAVCTTPLAIGVAVSVMVRPEQVSVHRSEPPTRENIAPARLTNIVFLGNANVCHFVLDSGKAVQARIPSAEMAALGTLLPGDPVYLSWSPGAALVLQA